MVMIHTQAGRRRVNPAGAVGCGRPKIELIPHLLQPSQALAFV
jgi:hypothetical protein